MTDTLIKVDLDTPATQNEKVHNRWHPDIPMACWVKRSIPIIFPLASASRWKRSMALSRDFRSARRSCVIPLRTISFRVGPIGLKDEQGIPRKPGPGSL